MAKIYIWNKVLRVSWRKNTRIFSWGAPHLYVVYEVFIEVLLFQKTCSVLYASNSYPNFLSQLLFQYLDFCKFTHLQKINSWQYKPCILKTKWKIVQNYKTCWNSSKLLIFITSLLSSASEMVHCILSVMNWESFSHFNCSLTATIHRTPPLLLSLETKKMISKKF